MDFSDRHNNPNPEGKANFISKLFFCWLFPLFKYGYSNNLEVKDLYNSVEEDASQHWGDQLENKWEEEIARAKANNEKPQLLRAIRTTFIKPYSLYGFELLIQCIVLKMAHPLILAALIKHFDHTGYSSVERGWGLAVGVVLLAFINIIITHHAGLGQQRIGMRCRVATCSLIYRKALKLNQTSVAQTAAGQIINLLSNDVTRFDLVVQFLHYIWIMPVQTVVVVVLMYDLVGYAAFAGMIGITLQAVPLQTYLTHLLGKLRFEIAKKSDHRIQLMNEIVSGIQVIKMYAWEKPFEQLVNIARKLEIDVITKTSYVKGYLVSQMLFTEKLCLYLTVITYALTGNRLTGDKVFAVAQFFNTVQLYMAIFYPLAVSYFAEAKISVKRIQEFLLQPECTSTECSGIVDSHKCGSIKITNGMASWSSTTTLNNISLEIRPGTLCAIIGSVGSGKSSLLQVLLRELPLNRGKLDTNGMISYSSQEPWLFVSTVRNNILFGQPYTKNRYKNVIQVCALERDFQLLPYGDKTLVSEKGVSLSGGQRARINLARSVYREADIYLFDDPLSAVDPHVARHLFEECILGYLNGKTRIIVTHQVQFLKRADQVIIINNGQIEKVGTFKDFADRELAHLEHEPHFEEVVDTNEDPKKRVRLMSYGSIKSSEGEDDKNGPDQVEEAMEKGAISIALYTEYFRKGGNLFFLFFLLFMLILAQVVCNASDIWITNWTNDEEAVVSMNHSITNGGANSHEAASLKSTTIPETINLALLNNTQTLVSYDIVPENVLGEKETTAYSRLTYIYAYTILIVATIILTPLRSFMLMKVCMNASKAFHNEMFHHVLGTTMRFFDSNPSGRILNRFSKDTGAMDEILPKAFLDVAQILLTLLGILTMVFMVSPWMIIPSVILAVISYAIKNIYLSSAQDIKRLEGITKSPAFSHLSASLNGLTTIRSSGAQTMVTKEFDSLQDCHTAAWFLFISTTEAFGFYLDVVTVIFLAVLTFQILICDDGTTKSGDVGLVISQSLTLMGLLQFGMRQTAELANQMTSVERISQYTRLEPEENASYQQKSPTNWPGDASLTFRNLTLTYVPEDPPVLKKLNLHIEAGEKVGVVGRTGAGKSSLITALFRLAPTTGSVIIDNIDTKILRLLELRSKISIIPQEPVLFSNTIRFNLDPLNKSADESLWKALEDVELKDAVQKLDQEVNEGGSNFSVGQRQLFCLARAILQSNKILVMDEATANVDVQTDALIQSTIRRNFQDCTIMTIAHRLNTVMDSDKILVMDCGRIIEFDYPHLLLQNPDGHLNSMVEEIGGNVEQQLRKVAEESYYKIKSFKGEEKSVDEENIETEENTLL